ncbi:MAG: hypothetical protein MUC63_10250 [Planctomycetes bacterium]|jgi:hypothetical protein|nr:hypothetical protein [Planctomycetota bacterium]
MDRRTRLLLLLAAALAPALPGCLFFVREVEVARADEARGRVAFENAKAWRTFHERLAKIRDEGKDDSTVVIPFVLWYGGRVRLSDAALFNDEAAKADADADGRISEAEAQAWDDLASGKKADSGDRRKGRKDRDRGKDGAKAAGPREEEEP